MQFSAVLYDKATDELVYEEYLTVTADEVRTAFGLAPDEYPGDCLPVTEKQLGWLASMVSRPLDLERFDCFVEVS